MSFPCGFSLVHGTITITRAAHHNKILMVDLDNNPSGGRDLVFDAVENLVGDEPFFCGIKNIGALGHQLRLISSVQGQVIDRFMPWVLMRQTQEAIFVTAYIHPETGEKVISTWGSPHFGPPIGHRTVLKEAYYCNPHDYDVLHRVDCTNRLDNNNNLLGEGNINVYLPRMKDITGTSPIPTTGNVTKDFQFVLANVNVAAGHFLCINTHSVAYPEEPGETILTAEGNSPYLVLKKKNQHVIMRCCGDAWWPYYGGIVQNAGGD